MSFYIKYVGGCEDISQLLKMSQQEAGSGNKVVLVCDKISYQQYELPDIPVFYNPEDVKSWTEESMHSLEGGYDAFYERRDIYD